MKEKQPEEAIPNSFTEPENPDYSSESRGLNLQKSAGNDGLPTPEQMDKLAKIAQAGNRVENTSAFKRAKNPKEKSGSAAFKSQQRTMEAMQKFYGETADRNKRSGYKEKIFTDDKAAELSEDCGQYMQFCTMNGIIPTWNLLAVWLNVDMATLYAEENLSSKCSRILKKFRNEIFTILEQSTLQREGNPAAGIFFLKSLWGLSDQQPVDVNVHMDAPKQLSSAEVQKMIELTPDEVHET